MGGTGEGKEGNGGKGSKGGKGGKNKGTGGPTLANPDNLLEKWLPWVNDGYSAMETGHFVAAISWVHRWDHTTRERVLLEKQHEMDQRSSRYV